MERRPLAAFACCWIAGSGISCLYEGTAFWLFWGGITLVIPLFVSLAQISWKRGLVLWIAFSLGAAYWTYNDGRNVSGIASELDREQALASMEEVAVKAEGIIVSPVKIDGDRADFTMQVASYSFSRDAGTKAHNGEGEKLAVQVRLASQTELAAAGSWKRGQSVALNGTLQRPGHARNFGAFDYRQYLRYQRIHWLLKVQGISGVSGLTVSHYTPAALLGKIDGLREGLGARVEALFPGWQAGYMKGLIIGLADELEPEKYAQFTNLGLTHILAISGSHVAINVGLLFGLLRLCRVTRETSLLVVMAFVPAYVLLTGFSPSVLRSGIMTLLGLYLLRRGLLKDGLNVLSAAAMLMLLWDPYYLLNVSFQLSFAVTAGLIIYVPKLTSYLDWLPRRIRGAVAITVAAQLVSFPLTIYYFNQFSLLSLAANMAIVPLVSLVSLPAGTAALLASGLWLPLGKWMAYPVRLVNSLTFWATEWLNDRSGVMTFWKSPPLLWIAAFYILLYALLTALAPRSPQDRFMDTPSLGPDDTVPLTPIPHAKKQDVGRQGKTWTRAMPGIGLTMVFAALILYGYFPANEKGLLHVQFIDVGQGDCTLITTPEGINILVDGGGTVNFRKPTDAWRERKEPFEVGAKTVVPILKKRGVHRLDAIVLTHGDQDHIGGLQAVVEQFPVKSLILNGSLTESATMTKLMNTALAKKIPIYAAYEGMKLKADAETALDFWSPEMPADSSEIAYVKDQNHQSLAFRLAVDGASFLFTGDMDASAEKKVLERLDGEAGQEKLGPGGVDVLKVAHHGSKTSTSESWVRRINPAFSVISVGASNLYGHPDPGVVQRLAENGSGIYRTDEHGEIQMKVDKGRIWVRTKLSE
ncbi:ComEC/Rec2 family competence protein [Paenibacillus sp. DYY-L-2]|uniref:ComEC/Rec2 family competence protein n=1 Tax=Paenibacillus sp. DYY-L-2 TaxID=3447013 RepID=UPI003F5087A6